MARGLKLLASYELYLGPSIELYTGRPSKGLCLWKTFHTEERLASFYRRNVLSRPPPPPGLGISPGVAPLVAPGFSFGLRARGGVRRMASGDAGAAFAEDQICLISPACSAATSAAFRTACACVITTSGPSRRIRH